MIGSKQISKLFDWYFDAVILYPIRTSLSTIALTLALFFLAVFSGSEIVTFVLAMPMGFFLVLTIVSLVEWAEHRHDTDDYGDDW